MSKAVRVLERDFNLSRSKFSGRLDIDDQTAEQNYLALKRHDQINKSGNQKRAAVNFSASSKFPGALIKDFDAFAV